MVRHVPWDEMPKYYAPNKKELQEVKKEIVEVVIPQERNPIDDLKSIGNRVLFGLVSGAITGGAIATFDVLRDVKAMAVDKRITTQKILKFSFYTSCFFAFYHGLRKTLQVYVPQPVEENIAIAAGISLIPVGTMKQLRPLFPYGILLVVLDAFNEMTDKYK